MAGRARIVIVGAGEAGARTALALREAGFDGSLALIGGELHLPHERPPLSKAVLTGEGDPPEIASAETLAQRGVELWRGAAVTDILRGDHRLRLADGREALYDKLVLATGATARRLPVPGREIPLALRSLDDARNLRARLTAAKRVAIVGAGFIGLELAAAARVLQCEVEVVEAAPRALGRAVPAEIAEIIAQRHRREGVTLSVGVGVEGFSRDSGKEVVHLAGGRRVEADLVVVGVGAAPATELAERAGLSVDNGIAVDAQLRTSDPDIHAIGDCASFPHPLFGGRRIRLEAWRNAIDQSAFIAKALMGEESEYASVPWFWSDQYELCLQIAGLPDMGGEAIRRDLGEGALMLFHLDDGGRLMAASAVGPIGKIGSQIRLAELLIAARANPAREALASPELKLKSLLSRK
jgi:3-phenylpropionate/trans-cinnamate dioxygenase ferredoxin reductase subunit